jgi:RNA polymerase sigma-70 factor (ECF subfamily)
LAIARNVCLRRRRAQGRLPSSGAALSIDEIEIAGDIDLEVELERRDLTDLLDRALGRLPADTRTLLEQRYAEDLPVREMAARQGISEGAVSLRLHRGREALRRVLTTDLRGDLAAFGLSSQPNAGWQATRIWCSICGRGKLRVLRDATSSHFAARCSFCSAEWSDGTARYLEDVRGPWRTFLRMTREAHRYYRDALEQREAPCSCCGRRADTILSLPSGRGVQVRCGACGGVSCQPGIGLVLTLPAAETFWREHTRIRVAREADIEHEGRAAVVTTLQSVSGAASMDVISDRASFEVLGIHGGPPGERGAA